MKKRLLSIALAMCMMLALLPSTVFAEDGIIASGECGAQGDNLTWTLDSDGTLTISGTGEMEGYNSSAGAPWWNYKQGIKTVVIEENITSIGRWAFSNCSSLTDITIPDGVTAIGGNAFSNCSSLTTITIPDSVTSIVGGAFTGCLKLASISVGENNPSYKSVDNVLFDKACKNIILYPVGKSDTSYTIPAGVTSIGSWAFYGCSGLTGITIPDSVTSIGSYAFNGCLKLASISVGENNPSYKSVNNVLFDKTCENIILYPQGKSETSYTIPDGVTSIRNYAFQACRSLTDITIPYSVTSIGDYAFSNCSSLTDITIPDSVTSIRDGAFYRCSGLTGITIPDSVTSIGKDAFYDCPSLTDITIPDSVTSIGDGAFSYCSSLTTITIPDGVTSIVVAAFYYCSSLTTITIPDGVTSIGDSAFYSCSGLTGITIPNSITSIGNHAFSFCSRLTDITIPDSVTSIGGSAFFYCTSLTTAYIPKSVTEIGSEPFKDCTNLKDIYFGGTEEEWNALNVMLPGNGNGYPIVHFEASGMPDTPVEDGYTVDFYLNDGGEEKHESRKTTPEGVLGSWPDDPVREGYSFKGWTLANDSSTAVAEDYVFEGDTSLYAIWEKASGGNTGDNTGGNTGNNTGGNNGGTTSSNSNYSISIPTSISGGTVTVSPANARAGTTVTITASPDEGYELESIIVKDSKGNSIAVTNAGNGKYTFTMPSSAVSVSAAFVPAAPSPVITFIDVEPDAYYADAVAWAVANGITSGTGDGKFSPNEPCTRSQIVTFLWRAAGCPEVDITASFTDVAHGSYYEMAVAWAVANGITKGAGDGRFGPNEPCTRAQAVTFLYRAKGSPSADESSFSDVGSGLWYTDAASWAVANGITNGTGNGRFSPDDICTRGQIVTFLYRDMV